MSAYIDPKKNAKKYYAVFNEKRAQFIVTENMKGSTDAMVKKAKIAYIPQSGKPKRSGQRPIIKTVRREPNAKNGYMFTSANYYNDDSFQKYPANGRYGYKKSMVSKNRDKYMWFSRSYQSYRYAITKGISPLHKFKNGKEVRR